MSDYHKPEPFWLKALTVVITALALLVIFYVSGLGAAPLATATSDTATVTLTDEPCAIPVVVNLPHRATWEEKGATHDGCYGVSQGLVICYFDDRTVIIIPSRVFRAAVGT